MFLTKQLLLMIMIHNWTNKDIRELIHEENQAYESCPQKKNNIFSLYQFEFLQSKSFCNRKI